MDSLRGPLGRLAGSAARSAQPGLRLSAQPGRRGRAKPVFLAVVPVSTSVGLLLALLKDADLHRTPSGQPYPLAGSP